VQHIRRQLFFHLHRM